MVSKVAFRVSNTIQNTRSPPIPQAYEWAAAYSPTDDRPLLDMSQGVPGVPPPQELLNALGRASASPASCGYPADTTGEPGLKKAMVDEMKRRYGEDTDATNEDIVITAGCNLAFVTVTTTLADAGDEIILPVPWYFNHEMTLTMLDVKPVVLQTYAKDGFLPTPERCAKLITSKTKAIVLVSPNNPTGAIYPPSLIASFATLAHQNSLALIIDETYRDFVTTGPPHRLFSSSPSSPSSAALPADWHWRSTFIHLFSFSKSYCIPGHRLGLICAAPALIPALKTALDNIQICAPQPPQRALGPLVPSPALREHVREMAGAVARRHALFKAQLPARWRIGAQGGYFAFVRHPFARVGAGEVCKRLAGELGVIALPGSFFCPAREDGGQEPKVEEEEEDRWIRFSVANVDDSKVELVCERLSESERAFGWELD